MNTISSCNYHIRALRHIRGSPTFDTGVMIACSIVNSRLDYCNSLLFDTSKKISHVYSECKIVQHGLFVKKVYKHHASSLIHSLHWLKINQ